MKTASKKAKGRALQQLVRDTILKEYPELTTDDVRSTGMGQGGEDVQLSPTARIKIPFTIECKNDKRYHILYSAYDQSTAHNKHEPVVVVKINRRKPLIALDLETFMALLKKANNNG